MNAQDVLLEVKPPGTCGNDAKNCFCHVTSSFWKPGMQNWCELYQETTLAWA